MKSLESLTAGLKPTGLYALTGSTTVDFELQAYAAGLDPVYDALNQLQAESFAATSADYGLIQRERLIGLNSQGTLENRRSNVLALGSVTAYDNTREALERELHAAGLDCDICENPGGQTLYVSCTGEQTDAETQSTFAAIAKLFLPAHLNAELDFRSISWNNIDQTDNTFDALDASDLTWDMIDNYHSEVLHL